MKRRDFIRATAGATLLASAPGSCARKHPNIMPNKSIKPVVISSANGNKFKNGGDMTCVHKAWTMMTQGSDVLDCAHRGREHRRARSAG